jgi:hypothetical protein
MTPKERLEKELEKMMLQKEFINAGYILQMDIINKNIDSLTNAISKLSEEE